jgi:hypothetical protein
MGLTPASGDKAVQPVAVKKTAAAGELKAGETRAGLMETARKYRLQMIVTDPEGEEVLNLTKLAFEGELQNRGYPTPDISEALQLLVNAAGEWSA